MDKVICIGYFVTGYKKNNDVSYTGNTCTEREMSGSY
jgi:hypothetical protein